MPTRRSRSQEKLPRQGLSPWRTRPAGFEHHALKRTPCSNRKDYGPVCVDRNAARLIKEKYLISQRNLRLLRNEEGREEERRVGKEGVSTGRDRGGPESKNTK